MKKPCAATMATNRVTQPESWAERPLSPPPRSFPPPADEGGWGLFTLEAKRGDASRMVGRARKPV
jgi:hypothetical protein